MIRTRVIAAPGRSTGLTIPMSGSCPGCAPEIDGLFWFSDETGRYDQIAEAAYLIPGATGPTLAVAGLVGRDCQLPVTWVTVWTPDDDEEGGEPGLFEDGARLVVYEEMATLPGMLEVSALHDGNRYGPILLTLLRESGGGGSCVPNITGMTWDDGATTITIYRT